MRKKLLNFKPSEKGQGLVEYALILVLVAFLVIGTMFGCVMLVFIPFVLPWLERVIAAAQDGSSTAIAQLVCAGIVFLTTISSFVPRLTYTRTIRIRRD